MQYAICDMIPCNKNIIQYSTSTNFEIPIPCGRQWYPIKLSPTVRNNITWSATQYRKRDAFKQWKHTHIHRICKWMFKLQYHMMCNSIPMNDTQWHAMVISYVVQYKLVEDAA